MDKRTSNAGPVLQGRPCIELLPAGFADHAEGHVIAISPHYDDAVFSCGRLLASLPQCTVVTVCTGVPDRSRQLTDWDRRCGFSNALQAMRARAVENKAALTMLGVRELDLHFLDDQYPDASPNGVNLLSDTLSCTISSLQATTVIFPLGLFHSDHIRVSDAVISLCPHFPSITWIAYEEIPYRARPANVVQRMQQLADAYYFSRLTTGSPPHLDCTALKEKAVIAYRSQLAGLGFENASPIMEHTEAYWRVGSEAALT